MTHGGKRAGAGRKPDPALDKVRTRSVGLAGRIWAELESVAVELRTTPNGVVRLAVIAWLSSRASRARGGSRGGILGDDGAVGASKKE